LSDSILTQPVYHCLSQTNAVLENNAELGNGSSVAIWHREESDLTRYQHPGHHTLSCYLDGGHDIRRLFRQRSIGGGAPGRICLMPGNHESDWDVAGEIRFMHLYFSEQQLKGMAERIQDKGSNALELQDLTFFEDRWVNHFCQQVLMPLNWQDKADQLSLSSASDMLLIHLLKNYCSYEATLPEIKGGLAPFMQKKLLEYIESHLDQPLTLAELAIFANLSEYHFARMFKRSFGVPPHQYVMERRLNRANLLLRSSTLPLAEISMQCGFSSQSHFSNRFRSFYKITPAAFRKAQAS